MFEPMTTQECIFRAVRDRGYLDGYSLQQIAARQVVKLVEEVSELLESVESIGLGHTDIGHLRAYQSAAGLTARSVFDHRKEAWQTAEPKFDLDKARDEIADCFVVLCCLAEALSLDLEGLALHKARADVARGVRGKTGGQ